MILLWISVRNPVKSYIKLVSSIQGYKTGPINNYHKQVVSISILIVNYKIIYLLILHLSTGFYDLSSFTKVAMKHVEVPSVSPTWRMQIPEIFLIFTYRTQNTTRILVGNFSFQQNQIIPLHECTSLSNLSEWRSGLRRKEREPSLKRTPTSQHSILSPKMPFSSKTLEHAVASWLWMSRAVELEAIMGRVWISKMYQVWP